MTSTLYRLGHFSATKPWRVLAIWAIAALVVVGTALSFGQELEDSFDVPGLDSQRAVDLLTEAGADTAGITAQVAVRPTAPDATLTEQGTAQSTLIELEQELLALPNVLAVTPTADAAQGGLLGALISTDERIGLLRIQYPTVDSLSVADLENLQEVVEGFAGSDLQVEMGGELSFAFSEPETGTGELIGLIAAVLILLAAFGSVIAMGLPIGVALFGLAVGISSLSLIAYVVPIPTFAPQIATMVGLGVGIDYALFLITRYRELLANGHPVPKAVGLAVSTAGRAVIFAGGTVVIAILGLGVAGVPFVTAAGIATSAIVLFMVLGALTLLPAFLGLVGHNIDRFSVRRTKATEVASERWHRWGEHVAAHALKYTIGVTALLLALTAPILDLQLGFPDEGSLAESRSERRAYDLVAEGFGPGTNAPLVIAVDLDNVSTGAEALVIRLANDVANDPGVVVADAQGIDMTAGVASIIAIPTTSPQDDETATTIERLRNEVFPASLSNTEASAHIGGLNANFGDIADRIAERLPLLVTSVVLLSFLLLTMVFRSILVALKAALLNLLSIGASYGLLVMVFQWGWGKELIGLETTVPIVSFIPMFMFAILFGLSMDYEVFLLSRIREHYLATGDNGRSVVEGLASTARVITSAALIMISVFLGFVVSDDPTTKMFGLGLATAIFVDASIVRMVLVPATMKLLGDRNWWLPAPLKRWLPSIDVDGTDTTPAEPIEVPVMARN